MTAKLLFSSISNSFGITFLRITKNAPVCKKIHKLKKKRFIFENSFGRFRAADFWRDGLIFVTNDPALETILNYVPQKSLTALLDEALTEGGIDLAVKRFNEFVSRPVHKYASTEQALLGAGQRLFVREKNDAAAVIFQINVARNPNSFQAYFALGEAYARAGKKESAIPNFEKSLRINPKNYAVIQRCEEIKGTRQ